MVFCNYRVAYERPRHRKLRIWRRNSRRSIFSYFQFRLTAELPNITASACLTGNRQGPRLVSIARCGKTSRSKLKVTSWFGFTEDLQTFCKFHCFARNLENYFRTVSLLTAFSCYTYRQSTGVSLFCQDVCNIQKQTLLIFVTLNRSKYVRSYVCLLYPLRAKIKLRA